MSVEPKLFPKVFLPPPLQDLLMREAVFSVSRKRIGDALLSAQQELAEIVAAKPRLSFVRQDAKKDHRMKVLEAEENVALLESAVRKLDVSIPALTTCVDRSLENYLREMDPEYVTGLSAARFSEDWQRFLGRFEQAVDRYMSALGKLPAQLEQLVPGDACGTHFDGRQLIEETVQRASDVQDEIAFLNKIADAQRLRGRGQAPTVHRQPERNWRKMAQSLLTLLPIDAYKVVKTLTVEAKDVLERVYATIKEEGRLATYSGGYGVSSYHNRVWVSLRDAALQKIVPDDFERIVAETETLLETDRLEEWKPERIESTDPVTDGQAAAKPNSVAAHVIVPTPLPASAAQPVVADPYAGEPGVPGVPPPIRLAMGTPGTRIPYRPAAAAAAAANPPPVAPVPASPPLSPLETAPAEPTAAESKPLSLKRAGRAMPISMPTARDVSLQPAPATAAAAAAAAASALPVPSSSAPMSAQEAATLADVKAERERLEMLLNETKASLNEREEFLSQSEARLMQTSQAQLEREVELEQREEQLREMERRLRELQTGVPSPAAPAPAPVPPAPEKRTFDEFNE
ncbi:MAG: hypothetical protein JNN01_20915 [Opitutaceae bacterium]|nr:hypothetical protein [Opitutaceae bacterium]